MDASIRINSLLSASKDVYSSSVKQPAECITSSQQSVSPASFKAMLTFVFLLLARKSSCKHGSSLARASVHLTDEVFLALGVLAFAYVGPYASATAQQLAIAFLLRASAISEQAQMALGLASVVFDITVSSFLSLRKRQHFAIRLANAKLLSPIMLCAIATLNF